MNIYSLLLFIVGCSITSGVIGSNISELKTDKNEDEKAIDDALTGTSTHSNTDLEAQANHTHITNAVKTGPNPETSSGETGNEEGENANNDKNEIPAYANPTAEDAQIPGNRKPIKITQDIDIERVTLGSPGGESTVDENKNGKSPNDANDAITALTNESNEDPYPINNIDAYAQTPANHTHIILTQSNDIGHIVEGTIADETKKVQNEEAKHVNDDIEEASAHSNPTAEDGQKPGNEKPLTQDIGERITGSESPDDLNENEKSTNDVKDGISTHSNTADPNAQSSTNYTHITITNAVNIGSNDKSSSGESGIDENEERKNGNDDKYQTSADTNPPDGDAETVGNQKAITDTQDIDNERITGSTGSESTVDENKDEKTPYEDNADTSSHTDTTDEDALIQANQTLIKNTQADNMERIPESTSDVPKKSENEEGKNENDNKNEISPHTNPIAEEEETPGNQKTITITQTIDIDRITESPGNESIVDENKNEKSPNNGNDGISTHSNTADPNAQSSTNYTHITITNAVNIGSNGKSSSGESGIDENEERKNGNDDLHQTSADTNPTDRDAETAGNQKPIIVTQDIDIERITGSTGSESTVDDNKNTKSPNDANDATTAYTNTSDEDPSTPADLMLLTNTLADETERMPESTSDEPKNDDSVEEKNGNDDENEISAQSNTADAVAQTQGNHKQITIPQGLEIEHIAESTSGEPENEKHDEGNNINDDKKEISAQSNTADAVAQIPGNHKQITIPQGLEIERIAESTSGEPENNKHDEGKNGNDDKNEISARSNTADAVAQIPGNHKQITIPQGLEIERIAESTSGKPENNKHDEGKNGNDDKNEISAQSNTADAVAQTPGNHKQITIPQGLEIERIAESTSGEPENDKQDEGKNINDDKHEASKHIDTKDGVALPPANHSGNHTHITITQAIDLGRNADSTSGDSRNDDGKNVNHDNHQTSPHTGADAPTPENQKPITITQDIEVDRTTESEPTVDENPSNDTNDRTSDTADAGIPIPASHSTNHTHITITQATDTGVNAVSPVGKSGNNENEEGKNVNDDEHETTGHTDGDAQTPDNQEHITITQDIDIERITESAYSESADGGNTNENSSTDADVHHPAGHTHITITQAVDIGRVAESIDGKSGNDENGEGRNANDDKHETSAHHDADAQTPGERKHITITHAIERTTESTDDENDANDEVSQHTNTNDLGAYHTANHKHITITQVIDIERIAGNASDGSDENKKAKTQNDDNSGTSKNTGNSTPGAHSSAKQKHVVITQVIDIDRIAENNDSDESVVDENKEESTSNEETNRTSGNINATGTHAHTPANHTRVTTQEIDIGRTAAGINAESGNVGTKTETIPINGETSADEGSEPTPKDVQIIKTPEAVPAIITRGPNETGSDESETILNNVETNKDVKCTPCPTKTELTLRNCSSCHCRKLWHVIECNEGLKQYIQRVLDNIKKLSKRANCKCNKTEYKA